MRFPLPPLARIRCKVWKALLGEWQGGTENFSRPLAFLSPVVKVYR
jgi:hypothetical protein